MNCSTVRTHGFDYFEQRLAPELRAEVDAHLKTCAACAALFALACETTCRDFAELCGDFDELSAEHEQRQRLERHLSICSACREYLRSYRRTIELARGSKESTAALEPLSSDLVARILAQGPRS